MRPSQLCTHLHMPGAPWSAPLLWAQKADIWSCGVLLFVMCTDRYPFR